MKNFTEASAEIQHEIKTSNRAVLRTLEALEQQIAYLEKEIANNPGGSYNFENFTNTNGFARLAASLDAAINRNQTLRECAGIVANADTTTSAEDAWEGAEQYDEIVAANTGTTDWQDASQNDPSANQ